MDWIKITNNAEVKALLEQRAEIENKIMSIDKNALIMYELEKLSTSSIEENKEYSILRAIQKHGLVQVPEWATKQPKTTTITTDATTDINNLGRWIFVKPETPTDAKIKNKDNEKID